MDFMTLPNTLRVGGVEREINSDFRPCFGIMQVFDSPDMPDADKLVAMVDILYIDDIPVEDFREAAEKAMWFLDGGEAARERKGSTYGKLFSWEQDARFIVSAVDQIFGGCRGKKYIHWWEFTDALMECKECTFSTLIHQRKLRKQGKQNKWDREWWAENRDIAELKTKVTLMPEERAKLDEFNKLMG